MTKLVYDYEPLIFKACCAVELRQIRCTNSINKEEHVFKSRTEFYGDWRKKVGGWLGEQTENGANYKLEDYLIEDTREVQPLENALFILKNKIRDINEELNADSYYGYVGGVGNFRKEICTLLPYKGNRKESILPFHLNEAKEYLLQNHNATAVDSRECDDALVTDMFTALKNKQKLTGVIAEKDFLGCDGTWYNSDQMITYRVKGFGHLERTPKAIKGQGRMWKYLQVCWQDAADNYYANCFSDQKNGEVAVYNRLKDCTNDLEAFTAMKEHFMYLYPNEKEIVDCRGVTRVIDWLYVMQECFNMAHLERWRGDRVDVRETMDKLGVK